MEAKVKTVNKSDGRRIDGLWPLVTGLGLGVWLAGFLPDVWSPAILALWWAIIFASGARWWSLVDRRLWFWLAVFCFGLALGWGRVWWWQATAPAPVWPTATPRTFEALVAREPEPREAGVRLVLQPSTAPFSIQVYVAAYPEWRLGDRVRVTGELVFPEAFASETGRRVDYPAMLRREGVLYQMFNPRLELLARGAAYPVRRALAAARHRFETALQAAIPEPAAALAGGMLLGSRAALGETWQARFRAAGLIHIVVLSGYNLTVVAEGLRRLLGFLPRRWSAASAVAAIILFTIMTGAEPATVRAAVMATLTLAAGALGRAASARRGLWVAAALMVWHNPLVLTTDLGFQLSVLATAGLLYLAPPFEATLARWWPTSRAWLVAGRGLVATTLAAQVFIFPLVLYQIGEWPLYALFTNVLILPIVPLAMLGAFGLALMELLVGWSGWLGHVLVMIGLTPVYGLLAIILAVARLAAILPGANLPLPPVPWPVICLVYLALAAWLIIRSTSSPNHESRAV